jgi:hypothetical protein
MSHGNRSALTTDVAAFGGPRPPKAKLERDIVSDGALHRQQLGGVVVPDLSARCRRNSKAGFPLLTRYGFLPGSLAPGFLPSSHRHRHLLGPWKIH